MRPFEKIHAAADAAAAGDREREEGNILVMFILVLFALLLLIGLALEGGALYGVQVKHDDDIAVARETTLGSGFGMMLKSSDDPAADLAAEVHRSLRENGCTGEVTLYFYEIGPQSSEWAPYARGDKAESVRAMAYAAEMKSAYNPVVLGQAMLGGIHTTSKTSCSLTPYAPKVTYKPKSASASYNTGRVQKITYAEGDSASAPPSATEALAESSMTSGSAGGTLAMLRAAVSAAVEQADHIW